MKTKYLHIILTVLTLTLASCNYELNSQLPTATFAPPTHTRTPIYTPETTNTPIPTATMIPSSVLTNHFENVRIVQIDPFDTDTGWNLSAGKIADGILEINGDGWNSLSREGDLVEGYGITINFKYSKGANFELLFDDDLWGSDLYKRFGVYIRYDYAESNLWRGSNGFGFNYLRGNFYLAPETWYSLLMAIGKNGDFLAVIWDPSNPSKVIKDIRQIEEWQGITWQFHIGAEKGTIQFDDYTAIKFDNLKSP